jgi:hypothetical protein
MVPENCSMAVSSPDSPDSSSSSEVAYTLGKTGQTVVYVFPRGKALLNRDAATTDQHLDRVDGSGDHPRDDADRPGDQADDDGQIAQLLAQGIITEAQLQVGRYDQHITGVSLLEALVARGWVRPGPQER